MQPDLSSNTNKLIQNIMYVETDKNGQLIIQDLSWYESRLILSALKLFLPSTRNTETEKNVKKMITKIEKID